jgi:hypothetical protein
LPRGFKDPFPRLPPGVTPSDIDKHFGGPDMPEKIEVLGDVTVAVDAEVPAGATSNEKREALRTAFEDGNWVDFIEAEVHDEIPVE